MNTSNDPLAMWDHMRTLLRICGFATMIGDAEKRAAITALVAAAREVSTAPVIEMEIGGIRGALGVPQTYAVDEEEMIRLRAALANFQESK